MSTVAEDVSKREHNIDGQPVYVKLYQAPKPRPNYPNKLKFSNVPTQVAHENLVSYLESAAKVEVEGILYGDDSSVVVATFKKEPGKLIIIASAAVGRDNVCRFDLKTLTVLRQTDRQTDRQTGRDYSQKK